MRYVLIILYFGIFLLTTQGQGTVRFETRFGFSNTDQADVIIPIGNGYIVGGTMALKETLDEMIANGYTGYFSEEGDSIAVSNIGGYGKNILISDAGLLSNAVGFTGGVRAFNEDSVNRQDLLLLFSNLSGDSSGIRTFGGTEDDYGSSILNTQTHLFLSGWTKSFTTSNNGKADVFCIKTDHSGNSVWEMHYGGDDVDAAHASVFTSDGNIIIAGVSSSNLPGTTTNGDEDALLMKIDTAGNLLWQRKYHTARAEDEEQFFAVDVDGEGNIVAGGFIYGLGAFVMNRPILVKTDPLGDTLWSIPFYNGNKFDPNLEWYDGVIESLNILPDNSIVFAGHYYPGAETKRQAFIAKYSADGDSLWRRDFGGPEHDYFHDFKPTPDGGFIVCGRTSTDAHSNGIFYPADSWLLKLDSMGCVVDTCIIPVPPAPPPAQAGFYPNPFTSSATLVVRDVQISGEMAPVLQATDALGRAVRLQYEVASQKDGELILSLQRGSLAPGVYIYSLQVGEDRIATGKMVVR